MRTNLGPIHLIGLAYKGKTGNANGQAAIDCGNHWQDFLSGGYASKIENKASNAIYAVYHNYDSDHTGLYSFFIGCAIDPGTKAPAGLDTLIIEGATYQKISAKGKMPDCVANAWQEIWASDIPRAYIADFEVYDDKSNDWSNAEVEIYVGVK